MTSVFQSILVGNPGRANWVLSHFPEAFWNAVGRRRAESTYRTASKGVPAYRKFLEQRGEVVRDFNNAPILDKEYMKAHPLSSRVLAGRLGLERVYAISKSSGSSGQPIYWPRLARSDESIGTILAAVYDHLFQVFHKSTLVVNSLALGTWLAGELAGTASRQVASRKNCRAAVISPGASVRDTANVIKDLHPDYEQVLVIAYPPFAKNLIDALKDEQMNPSAVGLKFMFGGEGFAEGYRDYLYSELGSEAPNTVIGTYASSDAGFVASETLLSVVIKRAASKEPGLALDLFGRQDVESMTLIQYNPIARYFESVNGELVVTVDQAVPLIRYNTHDEGGTIAFSSALRICAQQGFLPLKELASQGFTDPWKLPFLYVFGRSDEGISIGGANVEPASIRLALDGRDEVNSFWLATVLDEDRQMGFRVALELEQAFPIDGPEVANLARELHDIILQTLLDTNDDYRDAYRIDPSGLDPEIEIHPFGEGPFREKGLRRRHVEPSPKKGQES